MQHRKDDWRSLIVRPMEEDYDKAEFVVSIGPTKKDHKGMPKDYKEIVFDLVKTKSKTVGAGSFCDARRRS